MRNKSVRMDIKLSESDGGQAEAENKQHYKK